MNLIHRSIWNDQTGTFVAVSENTRSAGKRASSCTAVGGQARFGLNILAVSLMMACGASALAQPAGGVVSAGSATIGGTSGNMTITQTTPNVAINWQSFGVKAGESVQFVQPGSSSVALNRVIGANPSGIFGSLSSNGKVFLVNPNGILFGQGASVNVGGLVASTLAISDANFMANNYKFSGAGTGSVVNQGTINAADGGYVALLGANVSNEGVIAAKLGTVALAAGNAVTLDMAGDKLLNVTVDQGAVNALVENGGMLRADGGQVLMTTQAAGSLLSNAVNNTGVVQAQTLVTGENGTIKLLGGMETGTMNVAGLLDASAPNGGNGGFVETSAAKVKVQNGARVTTAAVQGNTGTWLIDPPDFTIGAGGDIEGATLGANLLGSNIIISSNDGSTGNNGDIHVNQAITWTAPTKLTLDAMRDVNINQAMTATNGSLVAKAGRDVNVAAAAKTTTGSLTFEAVNDVNVTAAATITTGNLTAVAGKDVNIDAAMTVTTGDMVLRADNDGTGPGVAAGTVSINCGLNCLTITTGNLIVRFNPVTYGSTSSEILAYGQKLTGGGLLDAKAWVFGKGDNKVYDGTTIATVSGLKPDVNDVAPAATLGAVSNANFDTKDVGTKKLITFNSTFNNAVFDLFAPAGMAPGTYVTRADITPALLTLKANDASKVYGQTFTPAGTAFTTPVPPVAGETVTGTTQTSPDGTAVTANVAAGPYDILITPGSATGSFNPSNYTITYLPGKLTVNPAPMTLKANDATKVYGATFTPLGTAFTTPVPLQNGETVGSVSETSPTGTPATASVAGSPYAITITPGSATGGTFTPSNYIIDYLPGTLVVTPAPLTVTANDATKVFGQSITLPGSAFTSVGLKNDETISSVTETSPGTVATAPVGNSPYAVTITPGSATGGTFVPSNYTIAYLPGKLTVTPVVTTPVDTTPVDSTPVDTTPVDSTSVEPTPGDSTTGELTPLPDTPYEGPNVNPRVVVPTWMPVVTRPATPPQLLTLAPPIAVPVVEKPVETLVIQPVAPTLTPYLAPKRQPKQDRN
jgi:filamentous hemagglutinin family protein